MCPGDWVITDADGSFYPMDTVSFGKIFSKKQSIETSSLLEVLHEALRFVEHESEARAHGGLPDYQQEADDLVRQLRGVIEIFRRDK